MWVSKRVSTRDLISITGTEIVYNFDSSCCVLVIANKEYRLVSMAFDGLAALCFNKSKIKYARVVATTIRYDNDAHLKRGLLISLHSI